MSPCKKVFPSPRRHRPGGSHAIDAKAATKRHFLHSYNVVHMPQGCGCVMGVAPYARTCGGTYTHATACRTWPALWENGANWPAGVPTTRLLWHRSAGLADARISKGEIDIVEGVNDQGSDLVSLHSSPGTHFRSRGARS